VAGNEQSSSSSSSTGVIIGVVVGLIVLLLVLFAVVGIIAWRKRAAKQKRMNDADINMD